MTEFEKASFSQYIDRFRNFFVNYKQLVQCEVQATNSACYVFYVGVTRTKMLQKVQGALNWRKPSCTKLSAVTFRCFRIAFYSQLKIHLKCFYFAMGALELSNGQVWVRRKKKRAPSITQPKSPKLYLFSLRFLAVGTQEIDWKLHHHSLKAIKTYDHCHTIVCLSRQVLETRFLLLYFRLDGRAMRMQQVSTDVESHFFVPAASCGSIVT